MQFAYKRLQQQGRWEKTILYSIFLMFTWEETLQVKDTKPYF